MDTKKNGSQGQTDDQREAQIEAMLERFNELREEVCETLTSDGSEAEWAQYELQDAYGEVVRSQLDEADLSTEDVDETDEDVDERFYRRCAREYRLGRSAESCAREWPAGGGR
jgi:hypothetical protein